MTTASDATAIRGKCRWCGAIHDTRCPQVKAIEFADDGVTVKRVEFLTPGDYAAQLPTRPANPPNEQHWFIPLPGWQGPTT